MDTNEQSRIVQSCCALGHKSRLAIFLRLLANGETGLHFKDISQQCGIPAATLSHHLGELESGGLIERLPQGRQTLFRPRIAYLRSVVALLSQHCCPPEPKEER